MEGWRLRWHWERLVKTVEWGGHPEVKDWCEAACRCSHRAHSQQAGSDRGLACPHLLLSITCPPFDFQCSLPARFLSVPSVFSFPGIVPDELPCHILPLINFQEEVSDFLNSSATVLVLSEAKQHFPWWRMHRVSRFYNECMCNLAYTRDSLSHSWTVVH